jgi:hypothetical protein
LLGVKPPAEGDCHEHDAEVLLDELVGTTVLIEADAGVNESSTPLRYVWIANDDQGYQLLNHRLIAEGRAEAASLPADARFGLWLEETERLAEADAVGLWGGCDEESDADDESAVTTSPPRQPAATATATVIYIWVDSESEEDES